MTPRRTISLMCERGLHHRCGGGLVAHKVTCQCPCHEPQSRAAERLGVSVRTIQRYRQTLRALGGAT